MDKPKLFQIGDVAKLFHLSVSSLRHYENVGQRFWTFARLCICLSKKMCFLQLKLKYLKSTWMLRDGTI